MNKSIKEQLEFFWPQDDCPANGERFETSPMRMEHLKNSGILERSIEYENVNPIENLENLGQPLQRKWISKEEALKMFPNDVEEPDMKPTEPPFNASNDINPMKDSLMGLKRG